MPSTQIQLFSEYLFQSNYSILNIMCSYVIQNTRPRLPHLCKAIVHWLFLCRNYWSFDLFADSANTMHLVVCRLCRGKLLTSSSRLSCPFSFPAWSPRCFWCHTVTPMAARWPWFPLCWAVFSSHSLTS